MALKWLRSWWGDDGVTHHVGYQDRRVAQRRLEERREGELGEGDLPEGLTDEQFKLFLSRVDVNLADHAKGQHEGEEDHVSQSEVDPDSHNHRIHFNPATYEQRQKDVVAPRHRYNNQLEIFQGNTPHPSVIEAAAKAAEKTVTEKIKSPSTPRVPSGYEKLQEERLTKDLRKDPYPPVAEKPKQSPETLSDLLASQKKEGAKAQEKKLRVAKTQTTLDRTGSEAGPAIKSETPKRPAKTDQPKKVDASEKFFMGTADRASANFVVVSRLGELLDMPVDEVNISLALLGYQRVSKEAAKDQTVWLLTDKAKKTQAGISQPGSPTIRWDIRLTKFIRDRRG
jgi:hypothetical protein